MSIRVKGRLRRMQMHDLADDGSNHEFRVVLDQVISEQTGMPCDEGVDFLSDEQFRDAMEKAKARIKKKKEKASRGEAAYDKEVPLAGVA
jgi:hypothetical protein